MKFYNRDWFNTVYHYFIREEYLGEGRGGLMNFLPLKRESLLEGAGLFKRGGGGGGGGFKGGFMVSVICSFDFFMNAL